MTTKELAECQRDTIQEVRQLREDWRRVEEDVNNLRERTAAIETRCGLIHDREKLRKDKERATGNVERQEAQAVVNFITRHWKVIAAGVVLAYTFIQAIMNRVEANDLSKQIKNLVDFMGGP